MINPLALSQVVTQCSECGSEEITWQTINTTFSDVQQGRLRTDDVMCLFVLGCDHCSETLATISAEKIAEQVNAHMARARVRNPNDS